MRAMQAGRLARTRWQGSKATAPRAPRHRPKCSRVSFRPARLGRVFSWANAPHAIAARVDLRGAFRATAAAQGKANAQQLAQLANVGVIPARLYFPPSAPHGWRGH